MLLLWGRALLIGGLIGLAVSFLPAIALTALPAAMADDPFLVAVVLLLSLSVGPLAILATSAGAILLLLWMVRRPRR